MRLTDRGVTTSTPVQARLDIPNLRQVPSNTSTSRDGLGQKSHMFLINGSNVQSQFIGQHTLDQSLEFGSFNSLGSLFDPIGKVFDRVGDVYQ
jgi:hypothetical protein